MNFFRGLWFGMLWAAPIWIVISLIVLFCFGTL